jgi:hypothetical protein
MKMITFLTGFAVFVGFAVFGILSITHSVDGLREVRKPTLMRSNSTPDLRIPHSRIPLYNNETYTDSNKGIISCDEYKKNIYNRYKRNTYLRSKEKYTFDNK